MPSHNISVQEAETHLSDLLKLADQGNEVVIVGEDGFSVRLVPTKKLDKRILGLHRGKIHLSNGFNEPLSDDFWLGNSR